MVWARKKTLDKHLIHAQVPLNYAEKQRISQNDLLSIGYIPKAVICAVINFPDNPNPSIYVNKKTQEVPMPL